MTDQDPSQMNIPGDGVSQKADSALLQSNYLDKANLVLNEVNKVSPCMCLAKWLTVSLHLTTGKTHSCYHPPAHQIPLAEIQADPSALHNTLHKKEQRAKMLRGERPSECQYCWNIEDADGGGKHLSDRAYRSAELFTESTTLDTVLKSGSTGNALPHYVEVNFNQACNFRCSYCSPHLSTAWEKEARQFGPFILADQKHNDVAALEHQGIMPLPEENNPYVKAFWEWWPELYKDLRSFRMTGGEPLIDSNTHRVLEYIEKNPKSYLQLAITSNCCPPPAIWTRFKEKISSLARQNALDHFMLFCSLDSWGKPAEYIRNGMDFDRLHANISQYLSEVERHSLSFIVTFCNMSMTGWRNYLHGILELRRQHSIHRQMVWFDTPMLRFPAWQSIQILPERYRDILRADIAFMEANLETSGNRFQGFKDFEVMKLKRVLAWMEEPLDPKKIQMERANFYLFFKQHDQRRGTSFLQVFPEMEDFWKLCQEAARAKRI